VLQSTKLKGAGVLDIRHGDVEFGICPAGFPSCFDPIFPHHVFFPTFWNEKGK
ncbi:hypothetical protein LEMLEM_LOCUS21610, partial [Lemmus lemmus]